MDHSASRLHQLIQASWSAAGRLQRIWGFDDGTMARLLGLAAARDEVSTKTSDAILMDAPQAILDALMDLHVAQEEAGLDEKQQQDWWSGASDEGQGTRQQTVCDATDKVSLIALYISNLRKAAT